MLPRQELNTDNMALYLNFPFCESACSYCHYTPNIKFGFSVIPDEYVNILCNQLQQICKLLKGSNLKSIYFGGGTPSLLSDLQLAKIQDVFAENAIKSSEVSIELHPFNCNFDFVNNVFFSRYSVAVQSFDSKTLCKYHRADYNITDVKNTVIKLRKNTSCRSINIDLIFDDFLPEDTSAMICDIHPDSVTIYPNTKGRGIERLRRVRETLLTIDGQLKDYIPLAKSKFIFLLPETKQSNYSIVECESFGDIIGVGHNSVSYIKDTSYLTLYEGEKISVTERRKGSRYISAFLSSLPVGVTYQSVLMILPEIKENHFLRTVKDDKDINEKHTIVQLDDLVYLPENEYIRFIDTVLPFYNECKNAFMGTIGFGDCNAETIRKVYNDYILLPYVEEKELRETLSLERGILEKREIPNCLILIEGIDGSGKDTFVNFFEKELKKRFKYSEGKSISIMGQPDSHLPYGDKAKQFIENLSYDSREEIQLALYNNRIESEKRITELQGIRILIRGMVTDRATYYHEFNNDTDSLGENIIIKKWDYYLLINVDPKIADKRIEERGIPRTWRETSKYLYYFSDYFLNYESNMFSRKLVIENTSLIHLKTQARKLANEIYATDFKKEKRS